jgi:hypothetical protein
MEDTSNTLAIIAAMARWAVAIVAALVAFLLYRWFMGPSMGWLGLLIGCGLFAGVALYVRHMAWPRRME